jgi:hypothetical protein
MTIMFLIITSKLIKIQSRAISHILGYFFAVLDVMHFLEIGGDSNKILHSEVDTFFKSLAFSIPRSYLHGMQCKLFEENLYLYSIDVQFMKLNNINLDDRN